MNKPVVIDLCCGLGGWSHGFIAEGWHAIGFDIERHEYGDKRYPGQLILGDVLMLNGYDLAAANPSALVASPPCQKYSYMAMPFGRGKREARWQRWEIESPFGDRGAGLMALFRACFRIQRELSEALGREVPMVLENVKGAQPWVGRAKWHYGSYYLWGDVPALMPHTLKVLKREGRNFHGPERGESSPSFNGGDHETRGVKGAEPVGSDVPAGTGKGPWFFGSRADPRDMRRNEDGEFTRMGLKVPGIGSWKRGAPVGFNVEAAKRYRQDAGTKQEGLSGEAWFNDGAAKHSSRSDSRKAASAMIAEIPFDLASHIARVFKP